MRRFGHPKGHQIGAKIESKKRHEKRCVKKNGPLRPGTRNAQGTHRERTRKRQVTRGKATGGVWGSPKLKLKLKHLKQNFKHLTLT